jgi:hypothetical protein
VASSTSKKVIAVRFDREPVSGFVNPQTYLQPGGVEVLTSSGSLAVLPYREVKAVCFVRDFDPSDPWRRHRAFSVRPKTEGLWVRFRFHDGDTMEGLVSSDLLCLETEGFTVTPPDASSFAPRVFIPRTAAAEVQVLGVIGAAARRARKPKLTPEDQLKMFE